MADNSNSIIDAKALSKPVSKLIDAVSKAIGTVYAPTHIKRMANAHAESSIIEVKAEIAKEQLKKRASERLVLTEIKRQRNIESISQQAFDELPSDVSDTPPDEDWMQEFFNLCQDVSDESLQMLWARLLAGEVSDPGRFSIRTMQLLKTLNSREASLFFNYCSGVCCFKGKEEAIYSRVVGIETNEILYRQMSHMDVIHLSELGLVSYKDMRTVIKKGMYQEFDMLDYFQRSYAIKDSFSPISPFSWFNFLRNRTIEMEFLTELGSELMMVAKGEYSESQIKAIQAVLWNSGIKMVEKNF